MQINRPRTVQIPSPTDLQVLSLSVPPASLKKQRKAHSATISRLKTKPANTMQTTNEFKNKHLEAQGLVMIVSNANSAQTSPIIRPPTVMRGVKRLQPAQTKRTQELFSAMSKPPSTLANLATSNRSSTPAVLINEPQLPILIEPFDGDAGKDALLRKVVGLLFVRKPSASYSKKGGTGNRWTNIRKSFSAALQPDFNRIDLHLSTLTDLDGEKEALTNAFAHLLRMTEMITEPPIHVALYDSGALSVIQDLLSKEGINSEVQSYGLILLNNIITNLPIARQKLVDSGGLDLIIKCSYEGAKNFLVSKNECSSKSKEIHKLNGDVEKLKLEMHHFKRETHGNNGKISVLIPARVGFGASFKSSLSTTSLNSKRTSGSTSNFHHGVNISHLHTTPSYTMLMSDLADRIDPVEDLRIGSPKKESVVNGLLSQYFADSFISKLDVMDKIQRSHMFEELLGTLQKIDVFLSYNSLVGPKFEVNSGIETILHDSTAIMEAEYANMYLVDGDSGDMFTYSNREVSYHSSYGIVGWAASTNQLINIRDPIKNSRFKMDIDGQGKDAPTSLLVLPITNENGKVVAVMSLENKMDDEGKPCYFDKDDEELSKFMGAVVGSMLEAVKHWKDARVSTRQTEVLVATTKSLGTILEIDELMKVIMDSAQDLLGADRCTLFLDQPEKKSLMALIQTINGIKPIYIPYATGIAGAVFSQGVAINIQDAYQDTRFNQSVDKQTGYHTKTILCMPIKNNYDGCIGVIQMINKKKGVFTAEDALILSSFSAQAAVALEKAALFKKTEDFRNYLQSILSSITSCVITLSNQMKLVKFNLIQDTMNRPWFMEALDVTESFMRDNPIDDWLGNYTQLLNDIKSVFENNVSVFSSDYEIKGKVKTLIVHYQVIPLIGDQGVVLVFDDISAEKRAVMTLGRYMSPALAKQVLEEDNGVLGGKRKKVSILFSDIRSFTTISEGMTPPQVVEMLNNHFTDAVNAISEEEGILDKFIGDAVMAVFGVPFANDLDAIHSCNAALKMQASLAVSNTLRIANGEIPIKFGVGINTGIVLSGNIGSKKRMEFSCIGDAVNLASRVEGLTKYYGVTIMITENTLLEINGLFITRELDSVIVTGKKEGCKMFELIAKHGDFIDNNHLKVLELYSKGLSLYKTRDFEGAIEMFSDAIAVQKDGPSSLLIARCKLYLKDPPPVSWTGVYTAEGK